MLSRVTQLKLFLCRLEKLMVRIGIYSLLYVVPFLCVIGSNFYEFFNMARWRRSIRSLPPSCLDKAGLRWSSKTCRDVQLPVVEVFMLKLFMSLVVGITSGTWVWCNKKSLSSWGSCVQALLRRRAKGAALPHAYRDAGPPLSPQGFAGPAHCAPLMLATSPSVLDKQSTSRSVTSKLSDRFQGPGRVSSSCV